MSSPSPFLSIPGQGSGTSTPRIERQGYQDVVFAGKQAQAASVKALVLSNGFIPKELVNDEVDWFYGSLGIEDSYFNNESVDTISNHIESLYGAKIQAHASHKDYLEIKLEKESDTSATYIYTSPPGISLVDGPQYEKLIDSQYLDKSTPTDAWRLESYRAAGNLSSANTTAVSQQLRCYFLSKCQFPEGPVPERETLANGQKSKVDIKSVSAKAFLEKATENTLSIYENVLNEALERMGPVVTAFEVEGTKERRVVIGYKQGGTTSFFSALSNLYHAYGLYSTRKYVEFFKNGIVIISLYLHPLSGPPIDSSVYQITKEASLIYVLPDNPFFQPDTHHSVQEGAYAYAGWIFAQHFLDRIGSSYFALKQYLDENDPTQAAVLSDIRARFRSETYTRAGILEVLLAYPDIIRLLYISFAMTHYYSENVVNKLMPTLSYQRVQTGTVLNDEELLAKIKKTALNKHDALILESFVTFNRAILKTNFFTPTKVALSFRLDPSFLPSNEYPTPLFGLFFVVGSEFRGFHCRFKDVARGGIRVVLSRNKEAYSINQRNLFNENYGLAATQALKNKDIPEGGSKGVILPDLGASSQLVFEKYVDSIIDLLLPGHSPGIKERIVDLYKKPEILFFGPDENTAGFMSWACLHARSRGAPWWKSFTTGKPAATLGGIPHDAFGMTSLSVRGYTTGIYRMLNLKEEEVTKVQTGGPDGDLGSNEILLSKDKTIAIIDGSGVLHDPLGIDREELSRLAKARIMVNSFDKSKLSKEGYLILCEDNDFVLPSGEVVSNGTDFRNTAHLRYKSDILVPCGGRPESVNINNVSQLWNEEGVPNFKYIVEGANLFITQNARLALEKKGVVLFRDSSANKGGVTSSSLEVLSGLTLNDEEFIDLMTSPNDEGFSDFYLNFVSDIQRTISANATSEFNAIWKEHEATGKPYTLLSDQLSQALIDLKASLESSTLYDDEVLRRAVFTRALPPSLLKQLGLDTILNRIPAIYAHSVFASYVGSKYIYTYGINPSPVDFYYFVASLKQ